MAFLLFKKKMMSCTGATEKIGINKESLTLTATQESIRTHMYEYVPSETNNLLPEDAVPVDAMDTNNGWRMSGQLLIINKEKTRTRKETFQDYIRNQEEHISQYYTQLEFLTVPIKIYELLESTKEVLIATDGGVGEQYQ
jgi:hypothetical protein